VAAPSASTIATAVAAAVPTTAGITTIVQANAGSPFGGTWTQIGTYTGNDGSNTVTFSNLSSYKYLQIVGPYQFSGGSSDVLQLRFNGDSTGGNYVYATVTGTSNGASQSASSIFLNQSGNARGSILLDIYNSNGATTKVVKGNPSAGVNGSTTGIGANLGIWKSTAAISSLTLFTAGTNFNSVTYFTVLGAV
jgi:hypothetical protein